MILAVTTQQALGIAVAAAMILGWAVYLVVTLRRRPNEVPGTEIELAPNRRPYFDDEAMEGPRLERSLSWALILLAAVSLGLPAYWLKEPGRQAGAIRGFDQRAVNRGRSLYLPSDDPSHGAHFGCATCHGDKGQGGVVSDYTITNFLGASRQVNWQAPPLNTVLLRHSPGEVRRVLVYGRPNTPMPAWGVEGGGPLNDQQIDDLVAYIGSLTLNGKEAKADSLRRAEALRKSQEEAGVTAGSEGETLFNVHCARCHTKGWSYGEPDVPGGGAFGPNLTNGATLRQFPTVEEHMEFIINGSDFEQPYGVRGVGSGRMPGFGDRDDDGRRVLGQLTEAQIRAIVEYERSL